MTPTDPPRLPGMDLAALEVLVRRMANRRAAGLPLTPEQRARILQVRGACAEMVAMTEPYPLIGSERYQTIITTIDGLLSDLDTDRRPQ